MVYRHHKGRYEEMVWWLPVRQKSGEVEYPPRPPAGMVEIIANAMARARGSAGLSGGLRYPKQFVPQSAVSLTPLLKSIRPGSG